jgi:hypothetical protein
VLAEKFIRDLQQDPRAIPSAQIAPHGTTMQQVLQNLNTIGHNPMRLNPVNIGQKSDTAIIVLISGIIQSLGRRHSIHQQLLISSRQCNWTKTPSR